MGMHMQASTHSSNVAKLSKSYIQLDTLILNFVHVNDYENIKH